MKVKTFIPDHVVFYALLLYLIY